MEPVCEYLMENGMKCGEPEFRRSLCLVHFNVCYDMKKTQLINSRHVERLADLPEVPYTRTRKGQW